LKISKTHTIFEIVLVLSGVLLSFIFLYMSRSFWTTDTTNTKWYIKLTFSFFIASFISSAIGMILERNSRAGGIFLLAVFLPFACVFYNSELLSIDGFFLGLVEGGYLSFYSYFNNRFDRLAMYLRRFIKIFFVFTSLYLIKALILDGKMKSLQEIPGSNEMFKVMFLIGIFFTFSFLLTKTIRGIRAYDVFVYGPSRSGKTLLLLAFYNQFVTSLGGKRKEIIVSDKNKESLKIENMLADIENGELPKSNLRTDLAIYVLSGKKGFKPVGMTFVDYGGEHTKNFSPSQYEKTIAELSKRFNIESLILEQNIGDVDFIKNLRDNHKDEFAESVEKVTFAHIYKKFESAGKIIFLVDGDHIVNYHNGGKNDLTRLFGHYSDVINIFGNEKSYAIVVTKIDMYTDLSKIIEDSNEAKGVEQEIYNILCEITTFKEIVNMSYQIPIYMYTVSVDATMKPLLPLHTPPTLEDENTETQREYPKINPWRVGEIGKFSF